MFWFIQQVKNPMVIHDYLYGAEESFLVLGVMNVIWILGKQTLCILVLN